MKKANISKYASLMMSGILSGLLSALVAWLTGSQIAFVVAFWLSVVVILFVGLWLRKKYPTMSHISVISTVVMAVFLAYLLPQIFLPGCLVKMPTASASCGQVCTSWSPYPCSLCSAAAYAAGTCVGCCWSYGPDPNCTPTPRPPDPVPTSTPTPAAPTVSSSLSCNLAGNDGWCRNNAVLNVSATQSQGYPVSISGFLNGSSNPFSCSASCSQVLPQGQGTANFTATSAGLTATGSRAWRFDSVPPELSAMVTSASQFGNWHTSDVTMTLSATDTTSGVNPSSYRWTSSGGANWATSNTHTFTHDGVYNIIAEAQDVAGNVGTQNIAIHLDKAPPEVNPAIIGILNNGWYRFNPSIHAHASDATSGIASIEVRHNGGTWQNCTFGGCVQVVIQDGVHLFEFRSTDNAGHTSSISNVTIQRDNTPPVVTHSLPAPDGSNGWHISNPVIPLSVTDVLSGVFPDSLAYRVNGSSWTTGNSVTISGDGTHTVDLQANDLAGNTGTDSFSLQVDTTPPDLEISVSSAAPTQNSWHVEPATAGAIASDATSGIGLVEYRVENAVASAARAGRFSLVAQSAWVTGDNLTLTDGDHLVYMRATDIAGNQTVNTERIRVDMAAPSSAFALVDGPISGVVALAGTSFDAHSGVDVVEYSFDDGLTWETVAHINGDWAVPFDTTGSPDGEYTILSRATDLAGHRELAPTSLAVTVNNKPPKPLMTESWWIWESGELAVEPGITPLGEIRLQIACGAQPDVTLDFKNLNQLPSEFTWNRRCGDGHLAPPGDYQITLTACNIYGNCDFAIGTIRIPEGQTPTLTPEPTEKPEPTATPTSMPPSLPATPPPALPAEIVEIIAETVPEVVARLSLWLLPLAGIVGSLAALGVNHARDPRPAAIRKLGNLLARRTDE